MEYEKIIVVSTNNNPDYWFYSPYIIRLGSLTAGQYAQ